ncbi:hypothetical protein D6792_00210 [Candidatus Parcubacteria bacterium]|nr:MAG: hypothetical protein D6792_00210 [Candidatus Parcubacteria bacterium]GIW68964.1 MAG: hypothetical protein KatS3mg100_458 [Candidatus Parcubacteria bacterium]
MGRIAPSRNALVLRQRRARRTKVRKILERLSNASGEARAALLEKLRRISPLHPTLVPSTLGVQGKRARARGSRSGKTSEK